MNAPACWSDREPDEPYEDWLLRLAISQAAMTGLIRIEPKPVPVDRNVPERTAS